MKTDDADCRALGGYRVRCSVEGCGEILETLLEEMRHGEFHEAELLDEPLPEAPRRKPLPVPL